MTIQVTRYVGDTPARATPTAAVVIPAGIIHRRGLRSVDHPKTGWVTDERTVAARVRPAIAA